MPQTTGNLSNSIRTQHIETYLDAAFDRRVYDQLSSVPENLEELRHGNTARIPFISDPEPGVTAISETVDVTPQVLRDAYAEVTWTSRGETLQWSEKLEMQVYTDYTARAFKKVGNLAGESIDLVALGVALSGSMVHRAVARASLDAGTAAHRLSDTAMITMETILAGLRCPLYVMPNGEKRWVAIMPQEAFHDLRQSGNIVNVANYQQGRIVLNFELGEFGPFKLVATPLAKMFGGAGLDHGTAVATTLNGAVKALDKTFVTAGDVSANIGAGRLWTIGTEETAAIFYPKNERVKIVAAAGTTLTLVGEGANNGLRFDHASGEAVRNADHVYPVILGCPGAGVGSPASLVKLYNGDEWGEIVGPEKIGLVEQWTKLGFKWYGLYGLWSQSYLLRGEFSASVDA